MMDLQAILGMLKANLEKRNSINDEYLQQLIQVAISSIKREGYVFGDEATFTIDEANLIVMYAAYLYRNRISNGTGYNTAALNPQGMPYMVRYHLNNAILAQKMGASK